MTARVENNQIIKDGATALELDVIEWANKNASEYDAVQIFLENVAEHGCSGGEVGHLIYYDHVISYFIEHEEEITALVQATESIDAFIKNGDGSLKLCPKSLYSELSWFGFGETAYRLLEEINENEDHN